MAPQPMRFKLASIVSLAYGSTALLNAPLRRQTLLHRGLVVDEIVPGDRLRNELLQRYELYSRRFQPRETKKHGVYPE